MTLPERAKEALERPTDNEREAMAIPIAVDLARAVLAAEELYDAANNLHIADTVTNGNADQKFYDALKAKAVAYRKTTGGEA